MRQIPFEHPKLYDPVSQETRWISGAAFLARTPALQRSGRLQPRIFMYGRTSICHGACAAPANVCITCLALRFVHRTYATADEVKPLPGARGHLRQPLPPCAICWSSSRYYRGLSMALGEWMLPGLFPVGDVASQRRCGSSRNYRYFIATRCSPGAGFEPVSPAGATKIRRDGAFHPFKGVSERPESGPLVSVLLRTHR